MSKRRRSECSTRPRNSKRKTVLYRGNKDFDFMSRARVLHPLHLWNESRR